VKINFPILLEVQKKVVLFGPSNQRFIITKQYLTNTDTHLLITK